MRRFTVLVSALILFLTFSLAGAQVGPGGTITQDGLKGTAQTLFGGAIAASVTAASATSVTMGNYTGGSLQVTTGGGSGTWSIAFYGHETPTGTFLPMYNYVAASGMAAMTAIAVASGVSGVYQISGIKTKYLKFVPTLSGTATATFVFTPSQ